ncbi:hypothetical protein MASR2M18_13030 [Ignavibacteria bacterium]|nr:glycosyltransferase [Bacteroidota bacterium]MCZ2132395.1 glycosyltransferase [Bacteroidota bacterium]
MTKTEILPRDSISVCIIARNEEQMLPDCLASVAGIAAEIIVVDGGSTDKTRQIALDSGAQVIDFTWCNDFSASRNAALEAANFPWILSIDADERLENPDFLLSAVRTASEQIGGFLLEVVSPSRRTDGGADVFTIQLLRLFRRDPRIRFEGIIHEQTLESILGSGWKIQASGAKLLHLGYDLPAAEMRKKQLRNLKLLDKTIENRPKDAYMLFQRAKTYLALGDADNAECDIAAAIKNAGLQSITLPQALNYGGVIAFQRGDAALAAERALKSLELVPKQSFANYVLGESYTVMKRFDAALSAYEAMKEAERAREPVAQIAGEYSLPPEQYYFRVGRSLVGLGQWKKAEIEFEKGLEIQPNDIGCRVGLANVRARLGDYSAAKQILRETIKTAPERTDIPQILLQTEKAEKKHLFTENAMADNAKNKNEKITVEKNHCLSNIHSPKNNEILPENKKRILQNPNMSIDFSRLSGIGNATETAAKNSRKNTDKTEKKNIELKSEVNPAAPLLSLCMIVKNEGKFLRECLESVAGIADEIIVVDTGSSDGTKEIARSAGAKVVDFAWINDFAAARNESLRHAHGRWILYLDADERLHEDAKLHLRNLLVTLPDEIGALICTIISPHRQADDSSEEHRGGYPRIFRRLPGIAFHGRVHEQITPALLGSGKQIALSDVVILHLGYNQSREILEQKTKRNYELLLRHVREEPENAYAWFQLGQTLSRMGLTKQAEDALRFAIELGSLTPTISAVATAALAQIAGNSRRFAEALQWAEQSLQFAPEQLYARHLRAYSLHHLGRNKEAEREFLELLERRKNYNSKIHSGFDVFIPEDAVLQGLADSRKNIGK